MFTSPLPPDFIKNYEQFFIRATPDFTQYQELLKSLIANIPTHSTNGMTLLSAAQHLQKILVTQMTQTMAQLTNIIEKNPHYLNPAEWDNVQSIIATTFVTNHNALLSSHEYQTVFAEVINAAAALHLHNPQFTFHAIQASARDYRDSCARIIVYQEDRVKLYHYKSLTPPRFKTPLLIVYALVNRPTILDLHPEYSLLRQLLLNGFDIYLIDWGYPTSEDSQLNLNDYINGYLKRAVTHVCKTHHISAVTMLGVCQGGMMSLCYSALYPQQVKQLITMVTPVDLHTNENNISQLLKKIDANLVTESFGNISGVWIANSLLSLKPFRLLSPKYRQLLAGAASPTQLELFTRMEHWLHDCPDHPQELFREFVKWFYQENKLIKNKIKIGRRLVNLKKITMPVFNIYANNDHLAPPQSTMQLGKYLGSIDYDSLSFNSGHIGVFVSKAAQQVIPAAIIRWLEKHDV